MMVSSSSSSSSRSCTRTAWSSRRSSLKENLSLTSLQHRKQPQTKLLTALLLKKVEAQNACTSASTGSRGLCCLGLVLAFFLFLCLVSTTFKIWYLCCICIHGQRGFCSVLVGVDLLYIGPVCLLSLDWCRCFTAYVLFPFHLWLVLPVILCHFAPPKKHASLLSCNTYWLRGADYGANK